MLTSLLLPACHSCRGTLSARLRQTFQFLQASQLVIATVLALFLSQSSLAANAAAARADETVTLASEKTKAFLQMLQSNDPQAVSQYVDREFAAGTLQSFAGEGRERYIGFLSEIKRFHGSMQLIATPTLQTQRNHQQMSALLQSGHTELNCQLRLHMTLEPPFKVTMADVVFAPASATLVSNGGTPPHSQSELVSELSAYIDRLAQRGIFSGAVLLANEHKVLYQTAKGMAELRYQIPNTVDTRFNLASMNKMFTAISILQLVAAKKLTLQDKLVHYLDAGLFGSADFSQITLEQLLTHTSGLAWANFPPQHKEFRQLRQYRPLLKQLTLSHPPGLRYAYSNEGMLLLGMVIEQVSGLSYDAYLQQHIFSKAGMTRSGNFDLDGVTPELAMGYAYSAQLQSMQSNSLMLSVKGNAAGGGYSTVGDLHRFAQALTRYQLLPAELTESAYRAKPELHAPNYGYGFSVRHGAQGLVVGHGGDFIGVSSGLRIYRDQGLTLIVLANQNFASEPVFAKAEALMQRL